MGKYEAKHTAGKAEGGKKKHIVLWIVAAILVVGVLYGVWFFTKTPDHDVVGFPTDEQPSHNVVTNPGAPGDNDSSNDPQGGQASDPNTNTDKPVVKRELKKGVYTFLLAGTADGYNTDTMMLCYVDTIAKSVKLVSVNRDTQIYAPDYVSIPKINGVYGWASEDVKCETMCGKVTEITGVPINYYMVINMNSFKRVIDMIGGVEYTVPFDMVHPDTNELYDINLPAGRRVLNGNEALQFVRYRSTSENDFGRVNRQKDFLVATIKQVLQKFSVGQIEEYIEIFNENVKTNMSVQDMVWFFLNVAAKMDFDEGMSTDTLPYASVGYWTNPNAQKYKTQSYVYLDPQQIVDYVNANLNPYTTDITTDDVRIPHLEN
ncbi:MAG: LCP family protein [Clostridia bacterium]|nr:LCP family protein [Clostridia bacterium]